jgi:uncharacterized protein Yka (UPF0111/DUF47 family)
MSDHDIYLQVREALSVAGSIEEMTQATKEINRKLGEALGDACPNGIIAEIEDIKRRIDSLEEQRHEVLKSIAQAGRNQGV